MGDLKRYQIKGFCALNVRIRAATCDSSPFYSYGYSARRCHSLFMRSKDRNSPISCSSATDFDRLSNAVPSKEVIELWRRADAVCFDVDSTVCIDEGIDELAEYCGAGKAVSEWTKRAMRGSVPFEEALSSRLSLFSPSIHDVQNFLASKPPRLSAGVAELITKLKARNTDVYLISGGFRQMIDPVARILGIRPANVYANRLLFGSTGDYAGFDKTEPTSKSQGKAAVIRQITKTKGYKTVVMIGDGATDLEARTFGGANVFIYYAGVQFRGSVATKADWVVTRFSDLLHYLN